MWVVSTFSSISWQEVYFPNCQFVLLRFQFRIKCQPLAVSKCVLIKQVPEFCSKWHMYQTLGATPALNGNSVKNATCLSVYLKPSMDSTCHIVLKKTVNNVILCSTNVFFWIMWNTHMHCSFCLPHHVQYVHASCPVNPFCVLMLFKSCMGEADSMKSTT